MNELKLQIIKGKGEKGISMKLTKYFIHRNHYPMKKKFQILKIKEKSPLYSQESIN